ncbi:MAG: hypothetical protein D6756_02570 [Cyanobacteria bacterium J083]|nr:MAG: hypothetical protein D6756_02570 [Cyanobacteria bacterium J083]
MKSLVIASISALAFCLITLPARAEHITAKSSDYSNRILAITPFNLVTNAYQGYLQEQGIPSNGAFLSAVRLGKINEIDLIESAIAKGRLSPDKLNDHSYRQAVAHQLRDIVRD